MTEWDKTSKHSNYINIIIIIFSHQPCIMEFILNYPLFKQKWQPLPPLLLYPVFQGIEPHHEKTSWKNNLPLLFFFSLSSQWFLKQLSLAPSNIIASFKLLSGGWSIASWFGGQGTLFRTCFTWFPDLYFWINHLFPHLQIGVSESLIYVSLWGRHCGEME